MKKLSLQPFIEGSRSSKSMKMLFWAFLFCIAGFTGYGQVTVTPGSGGTNICPTLAVGGGATAYTTLGTITVTEGSANDLSSGSNVITLAPPAGWKFNVGGGITYLWTIGNDITGISGAWVGANLQITITTSGTTHLDQFTIQNLQVEATSTGASAGYVFASVAFVPGIVTGSSGTDFADVSLAAGTAPSVSIANSPSTPICAGSNVTFTPTPTNGGASPSYQWFVNGSSVGSGGTYSSSILNNGDVIHAVMTAGGGGCFFPLTATSNNITETVNALPTTVTVSGGGTFCGSATLTASNGGSGTIYFQGTTTNGTSTILGGTPQTVSSSGTYYFRAQSAAGCWGNQGSAAVTINAVPAATTVSGGAVTCGGTQTLTASGGGGGTIFFQGTTSNGTSTILGGTPQTVSSSGTYYFRSESGAGCWGPQGSSIVTINPLPTAYAVTGGGSYCAGGSGRVVGLSNSDPGINYELWIGGAPSGIIVPGSGAAITFGLQTSASNYTVVATDATTLCTNTMTGSVNVSINPLPIVFAMNGGGDYCFGGTGVLVGLAGSATSVNYQLYRGGAPTGIVVAGTGGAISFGLQTIANNYTAVATDVNGCTSNMSGVSTVTIDPLPIPFSVTGGGHYCAGGAGVVVGLSSSTGGVNYQLLLSGVPIGGTVSGTGSAITFGPQLAAGPYSVSATTVATGCTNTMTGSVTVVIDPLPNAYNVIGGGGYCTGGTGVHVGLSSSDIGVTYQLFRGIILAGTLSGTGLPLDFGLQTMAGPYTVQATNPSTGCTATMTGSVSVSINPLPLVFNVAGGGSYCAGGAGIDVTLSGSESGVDYQLYDVLTPAGGPMAGTGALLDFGFQLAGGLYTAIATNTTTGCVSNMTGSANVVVDPLPIVYTVTGGGAYCFGGSGVHVGLSGSDVGISYQLFQSGVGGVIKTGTGTALDFGLQTGGGFYTVVATNLATTCFSNMSGSATVTVNALPNIYTVTSFGINSYCAGGAGVNVFLTPSDIGINYQLFLNGSAIGTPQPGNGGLIDFGAQTLAGNYTVVATDATTGCTNNMFGTVTISINPLPTPFAVTGGGAYCFGGSGVPVGLAGSTSGVNYELFLNGVTTGIIVPGSGSAITFGPQTGAGNYTVVGTNATTTCVNNMSGSVNVSINPLPAVYTLSGGGAYCANGIGVDMKLSSSDIGFSYQLFDGPTAIDTPKSGTGGMLDFGLQMAAGTYQVIATNNATSCTNTMTGNPVVTINPLPTQYTVTGGGSYCSGGTGVAVGLSNSAVGITYHLINAFAIVGTPQAGTGAAITFGLQTAPGFYTVQAVDNTTSCTDTTTTGVAVAILPLPTVYSMTGGGAYCAGGTGSDVGLSGSDFNTNYELFLSGVTTGIIKAGTGGSLDFGLQTVPGPYTIVATSTITLCTNNMSGISSVSVNPLPAMFTVGGGGDYCFGGSGLHVLLSSSTTGINYSLLLGGVSTGITRVGTSGSLDFGLQTVAGTYTIQASNPVTTCVDTMTDSAVIVIDPLPNPYAVTGGGAFCSGGAGVVVGLASSDTGITYSLFVSGSPTGLPVAGTGSAISFGPQFSGGPYTVVASNNITGCTNNMSGSVPVVVNPLPAVYGLSGGGGYCFGGLGAPIVLSSSDTGISYQPYIGPTSTGGAAAGTGSSLTMLETMAGTYDVIATNIRTGCADTMTGTVTVFINPLPTAIMGVTNECIGTGATLSDATGGGTWSTSSTGVATIDASLGVVTTVSAGTYTVSYTLTSTGCYITALDTVDALPVVDAIVGSPTVCEGASTLLVDLTPAGAWTSSSTANATVDPVTGLVSGVLAGPVNITYTVTSIFGCTNFMTASMTVLAQPSVGAITGMFSDVCSGLTLALSDGTTGGTWSSSNTALATVSGSGVVSGVAPGVANIVYTVTNLAGCQTAAIYTMTIGNIMPAAVALPLGSATLCHGNPVTMAVSTAGTGLTYMWDLGGTPIPGATDSSYVTTSFGLYTAIINNGTCDEALASINVVLPPAPVITFDTLGNLLYTGSFTTYQWLLNGDTISGATNNILTNPQGGSYMVVVTDANGCTDTSALFLVVDTTTTRVNNIINSSDIKIYPNPATSILYIQAPVKVYVTVLTTDGKVLMGQQEAKSLNVGELANGMYMIMIYDENNVLLKTDKFVKMQ